MGCTGSTRKPDDPEDERAVSPTGGGSAGLWCAAGLCATSARKPREPEDDAGLMAAWHGADGGSADARRAGAEVRARPPSAASVGRSSTNGSSGDPDGAARAGPGAAASPDDLPLVLRGSSAPPGPTGAHCGCKPSLMLTLFRGGRSRRNGRRPGDGETASLRRAASQQPAGPWHWLEELVLAITDGAAAGLAKDLVKQEAGTPLFVMAGSCPNAWAGMQAVLFCRVGTAVDFWWIKPQVDDAMKLERNTLDHHSQGQYKNVAERSKAAYGPLADVFSQGAAGDGISYGVTGCGRAFIDEEKDGCKSRMFVYLISEEDWSSFFAYMRGKVYYQKAINGAPPAPGTNTQFFARKYHLEDQAIKLAPLDVCPEEVLPRAYPPEIVPKG